jgi:hypothetical protein
MSNRTLTILGIIAAGMIILAAIQSRLVNQSLSPSSTEPAYLIQGLDVSGIAKIVLGMGSSTVTLSREDNNPFVIKDKDDYPATVNEINSLLNTCLDIKGDELITSSADNFEDLEVTEEKASKLVKFYDAQDNLITGLVIGKSASEGSGTYIRLVNNDDVYLTTSSTWIRTNTADYFGKELLKVQQDDIMEVTVTSPDYSYTIQNTPGQDPVLLYVPEGKKAKVAECKTVLSATGNLNLSDVMKNLPSEDLKFNHSYVCKLINSTVYTIEIAKQNDKAYVKCRAEFTDKTPIVKEQREESEEELKAKEEKLLARDAAEEFNQKHGGWIYELSNWQMKNLTKDMADLLEDLPEEKPAEPEAQPAPTEPVEEPAPPQESTPPAETDASK